MFWLLRVPRPGFSIQSIRYSRVLSDSLAYGFTECVYTVNTYMKYYNYPDMAQYRFNCNALNVSYVRDIQLLSEKSCSCRFDSNFTTKALFL